MGSITANVMMTLNGVAGRPEAWQFSHGSPEMQQLMERRLGSTTALLLGRATYEEFVRFWPTADAADAPMSTAINGLKKYVVSTTLRRTEWSNSEIVSGDVADRLRSLRAEPGAALSLIGSLTLVRSLLSSRLLDRLSLMVFPLVVEAGQQLFEGGVPRTGLELTGFHRLPHGVVQLDYTAAVVEQEKSA